MRKSLIFLTFSLSLSTFAQAPTGAVSSPSPEEAKALAELSGKLKGMIVWSSSRSNASHDLWTMSADGSGTPAQLTQGDAVDWFPRFSPDGKTVLFCRSKGGWASEEDARYPEKWDLYTVPTTGGEPVRVAENATWGTWRPTGDSIVFSRGGLVYSKALAGGPETLLLDGTTVWGKEVLAQEPNLSPDGKSLALTLRGNVRETGVYDLASKAWYTTGGGEGCQIDWFPDGKALYRVNPTGNGGTAAPSELLKFEFTDGKPQGRIGFLGVPAKLKFMDLPGRRSHEYFPKLDQTGKWLVWAATDRGHDHDIYDYELYLWQVGSPSNKAVRLTFHSGNDRWPDLHTEP